MPKSFLTKMKKQWNERQVFSTNENTFVRATEISKGKT